MAEENTMTNEEKKNRKHGRNSSAESADTTTDQPTDAAAKKSGGSNKTTQADAQAPGSALNTTEAAAPEANAQPVTSEASSQSVAARSQASLASPEPQAAASNDPDTEDASQLLPAKQGKIGVFGGPKDRGIKPDDKLALPIGKHFTFERVRSLNPKSFYCAMRWDYHVFGKSIEEGKRWWANKKLLVTNPSNHTSIVVRAVDYGPHENSGLTIAVSPGAAEALGVAVGDEVEIAFADPRLPVGTVQ